MTSTYHAQTLCAVTFIAKKEFGRWSDISVSLVIPADEARPLHTAHLTQDLDLKAIDPHILIEESSH